MLLLIFVNINKKKEEQLISLELFGSGRYFFIGLSDFFLEEIFY
jgi:hypothetical protein